MLPKVRPLACVLVGAALLLATSAGCGPGSADRTPAAPGDGRFGDPYDIVLSRVPAAPAEPPALVGDTLLVHVAYRGGCADHTFTLYHRTAHDTTRLWLAHNSNGDRCEAHVYQDLRLPVATEVLENAAPVVVLLNPQSGPPHVLRWGNS